MSGYEEAGWSSVMVQSPISGQFPSTQPGTGPGNTETRLGDVMAPHYTTINYTIGLKNTLQMSANQNCTLATIVLSEIIF